MKSIMSFILQGMMIGLYIAFGIVGYILVLGIVTVATTGYAAVMLLLMFLEYIETLLK